MPNGWKKNYKYFDRDLSHKEYKSLNTKFREWKKKTDLYDSLAPMTGESIGYKAWGIPKDVFNPYIYHSNDNKPLNIDDESNWALYLSRWKEKKSNQTFRHTGCRPDCGICNSYKLYSHGVNLTGYRKPKNKKNLMDASIQLPKKKIIKGKYKDTCHHICVICYDNKPDNLVTKLNCKSGQDNKNYICHKCRKCVYNSDYNTCPLCREHAI